MPKTLKELSLINWTVNETAVGYPGNPNIQLGCLQRIANATEAMSKNYVQLQSDKEYYEKRYRETSAANAKLWRAIYWYRAFFKKKKAR